MSVRRQLLGNVRWIACIALLVAGALVSIGYILSHQNLSFPWQDRYTVYAELAQTNGLEPGLGQSVNVAGVRVGTILSTDLEDGRAVVKMEVDPAKLPHLYNDARATLIPTTALKDLRIDLVPGTRSAGELPDGGRIPIARTTSPIDADELLSSLDGDTREFLRVLIAENARGLRGRGQDLRRLLKTLGPTAEQLRGVTATLAARRQNIERLVTNLAKVSGAVGRRDRELAGLVSSANATVGSLAREQDALDASLRELPSTLTAVRGTLKRTPAFATTATRALTALQPSVEKLPRTLDAVAPVARETAPIIRDALRPLARDTQGVAADLRPTVRRLRAVTPALTNAFRVLTYLSNEAAYNPPGDDEGFLHWAAWAVHNTNSILSEQDANGPYVRGVAVVDCNSLTRSPALDQLASLVLGALPSCPGTAKG